MGSPGANVQEGTVGVSCYRAGHEALEARMACVMLAGHKLPLNQNLEEGHTQKN